MLKFIFKFLKDFNKINKTNNFNKFQFLKLNEHTFKNKKEFLKPKQ